MEFNTTTDIRDVIIIGAGLSGLACALKLCQSNSNVNISIFESRERVGGRTFTDTSFHEAPIDIGGQWVGPTQSLVLELIERYSLHIVQQSWFHSSSDSASALSLCSGASYWTSEDEAELLATFEELERMASQVSGPPCWANGEQALEWDSLTAEQYFEIHISNIRIRRELMLLVQTVMASDPSKLSFLYFLYYVNRCGGVQQLGDGDGGAQSFKLLEGAQQISLSIANELLSASRDISLQVGCDVHDIRLQNTAGVGLELGPHYEVSYVANGQVESVCGRHVVVAFAPPLWKRIKFSPELPFDKQQIQSQMYMGEVVKCIVVFDREFWKNDQGFVSSYGQLESLGPIANLFPAQIASFPALVGLITGSEAVRYFQALDESQRLTCILDQMKRYFGCSEVQFVCNQPMRPSGEHGNSVRVEYFLSKCWSDEEFSGGCFAAVMPPMLATRFGDSIKLPILEPAVAVSELYDDGADSIKHCGLHFTCCELADKWPGYFEGAIDSGYRTAKEILLKL